MMYLCLSSMSQWPQTKVTWLVKNISLVLILVLLGLLHSHPVVSSPVQVQRNTHQLHYCRFETTHNLYTIDDLLKCMNELASRVRHRRTRSTNEKVEFFPMNHKNKRHDQSEYVPSSEAGNFYTDLINIRRGPLPRNEPSYYEYPAAQQTYPMDSSYTPRILGVNLLDAFSSISQYDDRKCVLRIICEVATGVLPGNNGYKQSSSFGINSLVNFLTTVNFDASSPLLKFGKSALMGYANKGNPDICYNQFPRCPKNPNDLINYLNNYNGGFFRFFNYRDTGNYNRDVAGSDLSEAVSDRKATGELKFDTPSSRINLSERNNNNDKNRIIFPDDQRHVNRFVQIYDYPESEKNSNSPESLIFPQDRKDQNVEELVYDFYSDELSQSEDKKSPLTQGPQQLPPVSKKKNAKLYLLTRNNPYSTKKLSSYTFPDGQQIMIDTSFSKLFSNSYKKALKRGLMNNAPRAINMEGLYVINLTELYPTSGYTADDDTRSLLEEQVIHPCDMICHDSRGTAVQFSQFVNSNEENTNTDPDHQDSDADGSNSLSTLMTPEQPILDLSKSLPCQVICLNSHGQRRRISTTFNKVLRTRLPNNQEADDNRLKKFKILKPRFVGDPVIDDKDPVIQLSDSEEVPLSSLPWAGGSGMIDPSSWGQGPPSVLTPSVDSDKSSKVIGSPLSLEQGDTVIGDNPLAIITNTSSPTRSPGFNNPPGYPMNYQQQIPPTTITICNGRIYIMPANSATSPACAMPVNTLHRSSEVPLLKKEKNKWGNYTHFFQQLAETVNSENYNNNFGFNDTNNFPNELETTTSRPETPPIIIPPETPRNYPKKSCPEDESWDDQLQQCIPNQYSKDAGDISTEDTYQRIPFDAPLTRRQRIVIKIPHANIHIQSN
ncbi:uncharacterized protein LOC103576580 [Microplitis demolitor]|uniref:uncharacterized protein LOC103576580 n=1 Tax=Microplitis demolitor TaxID=69319 RepID=UPI0004CCF18B|nr:uncharacterized protein LOC103576580 [Microplitis demolitor]